MAHNGISGDQNHSPRSLHSINRAYDLNAIQVQVEGERQPRVYSHSMAAFANRKKRMGETLTRLEQEQLDFWTKFSTCLEKKGGGTISHEDPRHQGHVHISLPSTELTEKYNFFRK
jgi:hypothetical protein